MVVFTLFVVVHGPQSVHPRVVPAQAYPDPDDECCNTDTALLAHCLDVAHHACPGCPSPPTGHSDLPIDTFFDSMLSWTSSAMSLSFCLSFSVSHSALRASAWDSFQCFQEKVWTAPSEQFLFPPVENIRMNLILLAQIAQRERGFPDARAELPLSVQVQCASVVSWDLHRS